MRKMITARKVICLIMLMAFIAILFCGLRHYERVKDTAGGEVRSASTDREACAGGQCQLASGKR